MLRELLLTVLSTTATKREARQYIQKYGLSAAQKYVSVIRISGLKNFAALNTNEGRNFARTLSHLKDLGSYPVVVLDGSSHIQSFLNSDSLKLRDYKTELVGLAHTVSKQIGTFGKQTQILSTPFELSVNEGVIVKRDWLDQALSHTQIPVMLPFIYDRDTNETKFFDSNHACESLARSLQNQQDRDSYILDKLIYVDPLGGLPSQRRRHAAHVIVNLKQEFGDISAEILGSQYLDAPSQKAHLSNLNAMQDILAVGGPQTTGIITDMQSAGNLLDRNPIIYNLLTERPLISPSLPAELKRSQLKTSLVRTGFPVYVRQAEDQKNGLNLLKEDKVGNINLTKLVRLIEVGFGRKIDMQHYLNRIANRVAAIIVVGDYDGAAIITWEKGNNRQIAYLDKFTVDPSSQGAQGVADIMLIQMIRRLFPKEMLWRSRYNNPVNKWYFERSRGHKRLAHSNWTMFWISDAEVPPIDEYEQVCRNIEPSLVS